MKERLCDIGLERTSYCDVWSTWKLPAASSGLYTGRDRCCAVVWIKLRTKEPPELPLLVISNPKKTNGFYERPLASSLTFSYFLRIAVICRIRFFECCENRKIRRPHTHSDNRTVYFPHFKKLPTALTRGLTRLSAWSWFRLALHSFAEDIQQIDPTAAGPMPLTWALKFCHHLMPWIYYLWRSKSRKNPWSWVGHEPHPVWLDQSRLDYV